jgi:hypothetical protein
MADIDFSGLWSWSLPLWGLFVLVLFLVGVLRAPIILEGIMPSGVSAAAPVVAVAAAAANAIGGAGGPQSGGSRRNRRVRFAE